MHERGNEPSPGGRLVQVVPLRRMEGETERRAESWGEGGRDGRLLSMERLMRTDGSEETQSARGSV